MKTLRKIRKNAKALSPVVASIILIAVTVAVSIAVAAWMGALTVGFMDTEQIAFDAPTFQTGTSTTGSVSINLKNTGTSPVTISNIYLNGAGIATASVNTPDDVPFTIDANSNQVLNFTVAITAGGNYEIKVVTAKNNPFMYSAIAPA
jgi:flagellin-like protein